MKGETRENPFQIYKAFLASQRLKPGTTDFAALTGYKPGLTHSKFGCLRKLEN